eukprot:128533_1
MLLQLTVASFILRHISASTDCGRFGSTPLNKCTLISTSRIDNQSYAISHLYECTNDIYTEKTYSTANCEGNHTVTKVTDICTANANHCNCNQTVSCVTHTDIYSEDCVETGGSMIYASKDYAMEVCIGKIGTGSEMYSCPKVEGGEPTHEEWDDSICSCKAEEVTANPKCEMSDDYDVPCNPHYFQFPINECVQVIRDPSLESIKYTCNVTQGNTSYFKHIYDGYGCVGEEEISQMQVLECDEHPSSCSCSVSTEECDSFLSITYENCFDTSMERVMPDVCVPGDMVDMSDNEEHETWVKYSCNSDGYTTLDIYYDQTCTKKEKECPLQYVYDCDYQMDGKSSVSDDDQCGFILDDDGQRAIPMDFCYRTEEDELYRKAGCDAANGQFFINQYKKYPCDGHSFVQQLNVTEDCAQSGSCQCGKGAACHVATQAACDDPDDPTFAFLVGQCLYGVIQYQCDEQKGPSRTFWKDNCTQRCEDTSTITCLDAHAKDGMDASLCAHYRGTPLDYCMMDDPFTSYNFGFGAGKFHKTVYESTGCTGNGAVSVLDECDPNAAGECFVPRGYNGQNTHCNVMRNEYCDANLMGVTDIVNYTVTDICVLEDALHNFAVKYACKNGQMTADYGACTNCVYTALHVISDAELCVYATTTTEIPSATTSDTATTTGSTHAHHKSENESAALIVISIVVAAAVLVVIAIFVYLNKYQAKQVEMMGDKYAPLVDEKDNL